MKLILLILVEIARLVLDLGLFCNYGEGRCEEREPVNLEEQVDLRLNGIAG